MTNSGAKKYCLKEKSIESLPSGLEFQCSGLSSHYYIKCIPLAELFKNEQRFLAPVADYKEIMSLKTDIVFIL